MVETTANKILLVGDSKGVRQMLRHIPNESIAGICMASIRPQYVEDLKQVAFELGVPTFLQPEQSSPKMTDFVTQIQDLQAEMLLMNSYSMRIGTEVLALFPKGCFNIHAALLPKNRGPNPIQWVILKGETQTGVTLHRVSQEFDQGEIVDQVELKVLKNDSWLDISDKLDRATDYLLARNRPQLLNGVLQSHTQDENVATKNRRRSAADSRFKWSDPIKHIYRLHLAALPPLPPATTENYDGSIFSFKRKTSLIWLTIIVVFNRTVRLFHPKREILEN
jgi:methionyl-tRNA formyltransferase